MFYSIIIKKGDQVQANRQMGMKEGMIIDYHDWALGNPNYSNDMKRIFTIINVVATPRLKRFLQKAIASGDDLVNRERSYIISDLRQFAINIGGGTALYDDWGSSKSVEPVTPSAEIQDDLESHFQLAKDIDFTTRTPIRDGNALTSGTATVGTAGTYATFSAAFADLGTFTADVTLNMISAITETSKVNISNNNGGFDMYITSDSDPLGDITAGNILSINQADHMFRLLYTGGGMVKIDKMNFVRILNGSSSSKRLMSLGSLRSYTMTNTIYDGGGLTGGGLDAGASCIITNTMLEDITTEGIRIISSGVNIETTGIHGSGGHGIISINTSYTGTIKDVYALASATADFDSLNSMTKNNLGSSDATADGTAPQTNLTTADEIETNSALSTFMDLKSGHSMVGVVPVQTSNDIRGNAWGSPYVMGPKQLLSSSASSPYYAYAQMQ